MGNNQSNAMRAQLAQAQRQIQSLQAQTKAADATRRKVVLDQKEALAKEQAVPERMSVNSARFSQAGTTIEQPVPVQLTLAYESGTLSKPLQLVQESSKRGLELTEKRQSRTLGNGTKVAYRLYHGLTDPTSQAPGRPGYGVQRHTFHKDLIFVVRVENTGDRTVPQSMTEEDVKWVWNYLRSHQPNSGAVNLRDQMAQQMGRPGVPMPYVEGSAPVRGMDPYSLNTQIPSRNQPTETIQFRPPSAFPSDQIHFQQVDNR